MLSYAIVTLAFSLVAGWAMLAQRSAAREAVMMRSGYLPLALALRDAVASQDIWNAQLNHITTAKNPTDKRVWFEASLRGGRPKTFQELRAALELAFSDGQPEILREMSADTAAIEELLSRDRELLARLFDAINERDDAKAESLREQLVTRGHQVRKRLRQLEQRVQHVVDGLLAAARTREQWAIRFLLVLSGLTVVVGIVMALYARRVLKPLTAVTARAKAVAEGDLTARPVVASNDEIGELAATFESMVGAIARANAELLAAERLATIGKMSAHVTHEIRNPLSSLALNVDLLEEELGSGNLEATSLLRAVKNEVDRLSALSERYLSFAGRQALRLQDEDLGEICREAAQFLRGDLERRGVECRVEVEEGVPPVPVDEGQVRQALYNLIRNAREAMPGGGLVVVGVRRRKGGGVVITVDDEGQGMDEATREKLFEPFFTTKGHGTGLGLVITRDVVEAHGGTIRCEPRWPRGTRFEIYLPASSVPRGPSGANRPVEVEIAVSGEAETSELGKKIPG